MDSRDRSLAERVARLEHDMTKIGNIAEAFIAVQAAKIAKLEAFVDAFDEETAADNAYFSVEWSTDQEEDEARHRMQDACEAVEAARAAIDWKPTP